MRKNKQPCRQQLFSQPIERLREFVRHGSRAHAEQCGRLSLRVLLEHYAAQHLPIERAKPLQAALHVEHEDNRVLKRADRAA